MDIWCYSKCWKVLWLLSRVCLHISAKRKFSNGMEFEINGIVWNLVTEFVTFRISLTRTRWSTNEDSKRLVSVNVIEKCDWQWQILMMVSKNRFISRRESTPFYVEISQLTMPAASSMSSSSSFRSSSSGSSIMISGLKHSETLLEERPEELELLRLDFGDRCRPFIFLSLKAKANFQLGIPRRLFWCLAHNFLYLETKWEVLGIPTFDLWVATVNLSLPYFRMLA